MKSNASGTARIATIPNGAQFNGNIRMQKYIPQGGRYWYQLASSVSSGTVAQWQTGSPSGGFYVTGPFTGASNPGNGITSSGVSAYNWNAGSGTYDRYPVSSNTEIISPKIGYRVFVRDGNATYNEGITSAKTFSVYGTPNVGVQSFNLLYSPIGGNPSGGWNLIGNPYPSDISADLNLWNTTNANLDGSAVYIWDAFQSSYVVCNGGIGDCNIPSSQGFWVKVNPGGGTLIATENVKISGSQPLYRISSSTPNYIPVVLNNPQYNIKDIAYLRFEDNANDNFDNQYDAYKLNIVGTGGSLTKLLISSQMDATTELSINARPIPVDGQDTIPLNVGGYPGTQTLDFSNRSHLSTDYSLILIDKYTNTETNLDVNPIYDFEVTAANAASVGQRFNVVFKYTNTEITTSNQSTFKAEPFEIYPNPTTTSNFTVKSISNKGDVKITITDILGKKVFEKTYSASTLIDVNANNHLIRGTYVVIIKNSDLETRTKLMVE